MDRIPPYSMTKICCRISVSNNIGQLFYFERNFERAAKYKSPANSLMEFLNGKTTGSLIYSSVLSRTSCAISAIRSRALPWSMNYRSLLKDIPK